MKGKDEEDRISLAVAFTLESGTLAVRWTYNIYMVMKVLRRLQMREGKKIVDERGQERATFVTYLMRA